MGYTPQVWHNEPATDTPVSAARLEYLETGLDVAADVADSAQTDATAAASAVTAHVADATAAHAATAISFTPAGTIAATTVQAAIEEVASEASGGSGYTQEQIEDFVGGMVTGNTETGIAVTYDDAGGKLDFVVSAGATNDPYSLLTTPGGAEWGVEFDSALDGSWVKIDAAAGTTTVAQGNHRFGMGVSAASDTAGASYLRPIGTTWANGSSFEVEMQPNSRSAFRGVMMLADGNTSSAQTLGIMNYTNGGNIFMVKGTPIYTFAVSFTDYGAMNGSIARLRYRLIQTSGTISLEYSNDGALWVVLGTTTIGWTPTHCGFAMSGVGSISSDYVRRYA